MNLPSNARSGSSVSCRVPARPECASPLSDAVQRGPCPRPLCARCRRQCRAAPGSGGDSVRRRLCRRAAARGACTVGPVPVRWPGHWRPAPRGPSRSGAPPRPALRPAGGRAGRPPDGASCPVCRNPSGWGLSPRPPPCPDAGAGQAGTSCPPCRADSAAPGAGAATRPTPASPGAAADRRPLT